MSEYNIVVFGAEGVGKSATTIQFVQNAFVEEYDPTLEDWFRKEATIDDETVVLSVLDSAGKEEFPAMRDEYMRRGHGFILMYSITERQTFEQMPEFFKLIYM
mmetsp:Transcript_26247/g.29220  ORF Transcript_26247/g.29220 Transcript_26247/m.29220 type:complete len:103 (+) Transcript_26247:305-613(+)